MVTDKAREYSTLNKPISLRNLFSRLSSPTKKKIANQLANFNITLKVTFPLNNKCFRHLHDIFPACTNGNETHKDLQIFNFSN